MILDKKEEVLVIFDSWITYESTVGSIDECTDQVKAIVTVTEHSDVVDKVNDMDFSRYRD
jgi:hypothetical protein